MPRSVQELEAMLSTVCTALEQQTRKPLKEIDYCQDEIAPWFDDYKEESAAREARDKALAKLSTADRKALGIPS